MLAHLLVLCFSLLLCFLAFQHLCPMLLPLQWLIGANMIDLEGAAGKSQVVHECGLLCMSSCACLLQAV